MRQITQKSNYIIENISIRATKWIGSTGSILVHTLLFIVAFVLYFFGIDIDKILLVVTTLVSLEAIYLSIFIQMSVNRQATHLEAVAQDVEDIQEDVGEIQKDVDEIQEDVDEIQVGVEGIEKDVEEIQEDVGEITEDINEADSHDEASHDVTLSRIEDTLKILINDISELKKQQDQNLKIKTK